MRILKKAMNLLGIAAFLFSTDFIIAQASIASQDPAPKAFPLPELEYPRQICAEGGKVYIVDRTGILAYNINDGLFLTKIGKTGQGPGEFQRIGHLAVFPDKLVVRDFPKIKFFTLDGKYINEIHEPDVTGFYPFLPIGENFTGFPMNFNDDGSISPPTGQIYDKDFHLIKHFFGAFSLGQLPPPPPGSSAQKMDWLMIRNYEDYSVYGDKIFVADSSKGLRISVYDGRGNFLYDIRHAINKVKVPREYLENAIKVRKTSKGWDSFNSMYKPIVPDYFPYFFGFKIDGDRIYVVTPSQKAGLYEVIVMNLKGEIIDRSYRFPINPNYENPALFNWSYDIERNQIIWFNYNDEKELYELHIR